jgi:hypothetical protein
MPLQPSQNSNFLFPTNGNTSVADAQSREVERLRDYYSLSSAYAQDASDTVTARGNDITRYDRL